MPDGGIADEESIAAIIRITGGNFRLLNRLSTQIGRVLEINKLEKVTLPVVEAARESLVIGTAWAIRETFVFFTKSLWLTDWLSRITFDVRQGLVVRQSPESLAY